MGSIWSEEAKLQSWWKVELAVLGAFEEHGVITAGELQMIRERVSWSVEDVQEAEKTLRHDMLAFLEVLQAGLGSLSKYVHRGLTSSDVKDTATSLRIAESLKLLEKALDKIDGVLVKLALEHRDTVMIGRTHGVHAEPTTFGIRCLNWLTEWRRHRQRLQQAVERLAVGKISGAVGTYSQFDPEIEELALKKLGLGTAPVSSQILQRDRHAELLGLLANIGGTIEKMAVEVRNLQRTEIRELEERFGSGQKGSSAMPHKRNPIVAERLSGQARCLRGYAVAGYETEALWHERDLSNSSTERIVIPDALNLTHYMLLKLAELFRNLKVDRERMRENLSTTRGLIYSQKLLVKLMESGWDRKKAYEVVQRAARVAWEEGADFEAEIKSNPQILRALGEPELAGCFSVEQFLQRIDYIYRRVLGDDQS